MSDSRAVGFFVAMAGLRVLIPEDEIGQGKFSGREDLRLYSRVGRIWWITNFTMHMNL